MKHTVKTIAADFGVAPSTISKIMNHTGNFSDELRVKVLNYIKEIDYVPVYSARVLKSYKSWNIGIIYTEETKVGLEHPFFSAVLQSFKDYVEKEGYDLSFIVHQIGRNQMSYLKWCKNKKIDGVLIVVGSHNNKDLIELSNSDIPCVSTDVVRENIQTINSDNGQGIRLSIELAIKLGIKKIGMIAGPLTARHFLDRFSFYKETLKENNLEFNEQWVISAKGFGYSSGYAAALKLFERNCDRPELLLIGSDLIAFGAINAFKSVGFKIPEDIQIIGFDDISFAKMFSPKLTTIKQNTKQIGIKAAQKLISMIDNKDPNSTGVSMIPVELIERETTTSIK